MAVDANSLVSLDEALAYLGEDYRRNALWIYCSQGDATAATCEVTDTTLSLVITGGATSPLTLADSDKNSIEELVDAINALTGWTAGRICHSNAESGDLVITGAMSSLGSANRITLIIKDNYIIERLIDRSTALIERYCNRKLLTRSYTRETYWGDGYDRLALDQYPVTRVNRLSQGRANSFSLLNTSADANYCTVEVTDTVMRLIVDGGANADDTSLTLADYATIDALIAALPAKGWSATTIATDTGTRDASELLVRPAMFVNGTTRAYLETVDEDLTDYLSLNPSEDRNCGMLYRSGGFTAGMEFFVDYVAGYTTVPYDLELLCLELVKHKLDSSRSSGMQSESLGDYSYTRFSPTDFNAVFAANPELKASADFFKKRVI